MSSSQQNTISQLTISDPQLLPMPSSSINMPAAKFLDNSSDIKASRTTYIRLALLGTFMVIMIIFTCLPLYWGALWKAPKPLPGFIVDFDGSTIGSNISEALKMAPVTSIRWEVVPSSRFPGGPAELATAIREEKAWIAISINPNATQGLQNAAESGDSSYDGTLAITAYGAEARQDNAYRNLLRTNLQINLPPLLEAFASNFSLELASSSHIDTIIQSAPQVLLKPVSYTLDNLLPYDIPVATAVTFVGLIYLLILTFFILSMMMQARLISGLEMQLSTASLIRLRLGTVAISYLIIALFYTCLNRAFQIDLTRKFGFAGFSILWMINYFGMLAMGLALESMLTILTPKFLPFFLVPWVVVNVSVSSLPIETQVDVFRFGYAVPFYNISRAVRTVIFGTKNELVLNFAILFAWAVLSSCTLSLFQVYTRRKVYQQLVDAEKVNESG